MIDNLIVGVGGGTASGKTSIARGLAALLGPDRCLLLSHDMYYRTLPDTYRHDPASYNYDEPASLESPLLVQHLDRLRQGEAVDVPRYDFSVHQRRGTTRVDPRPVIVIEGILVLAEAELRAAFDHRVFVDVPEHVRLGRRILRDRDERGRPLDDVLEQYFATVRPMHELWVEPSRRHADLVLDGRVPVDDSVRTLLGHLHL